MAGKLFAISAPSGCGKTTILKQILKIFPDLYFSVSATTRPKRETETDGKDYFFLTKKEFQEHLDADDFVEWNEHFENRYGTLKSNIAKHVKEGEDIIFDLDVNGSINIKKYDPDSVTVFIKPPDIKTLRERLLNRGTENENTIEIRLKRAEEEIEKSKYFDYIIVNDDLDTAITEVKNIILKYKRG
jgi:guanylate kinase